MQSFDREKALKTFGSADVLREAGAVYLAEAEGMFGQLRQAAETRDFEALREKAHWIKGGMVYLHATPAAETARAIEQAAKDGEESTLDPLVEQLGQQMAALGRALSQEVAR
ncbi:MAG: Hpt domain-containing protein [Candidatus Eremiobacteraeota bacterium]|nr:Hpt domain-containing protein [Candidatus Eremiobacteraeota bacterium]